MAIVPRPGASRRAANRVALAEVLFRAMVAGHCLADCTIWFPSESGQTRSRRFLVEVLDGELRIVGESIKPLELAALAQAFLVARGAGKPSAGA